MFFNSVRCENSKWPPLKVNVIQTGKEIAGKKAGHQHFILCGHSVFISKAIFS